MEQFIYHNEDKTRYSVEIVDVSPELAQAWLNMNVENNRNPSKSKFGQYSRDMGDRHWMLNGEAIKFNILGQLMDGQNRLLAVIKSGVTVPMFVIRNLPVEAFHTLDHGYTRPQLWWMPKEKVATAVAMATIAGGHAVRTAERRPTEKEMEAFLSKHERAVDFSVNAVPKERGFTAVFRAIVARSTYHLDKADIIDFLDCVSLRKTFPQYRQMPVMRLRGLLTDNVRAGGGRDRSSNAALEKYLKTERCLSAFVNHERMTKLYAAAKELFPIYEDDNEIELMPAATVRP